MDTNTTKRKTAGGRMRPECVNWDPEVRIKKNGSAGSVGRKVLDTGIRRIALGPLEDELLRLLRQGHDVRLTGGDGGDALRLYPCMTPELDRMLVIAQTMGGFRKALEDKKVRLVHCGRDVGDDEAEALVDEARSKGRSRYAPDVECVTPDPIVTCPKCGYRFRSGRRVSEGR